MPLTNEQLAAINLVNSADNILGACVMEAALALHKSHDGIRSKLFTALRTKLGLSGDSYWASDFQLESVFDTNVVYRFNGKEWRQPYTNNNGEVTLDGDAVETELSFIDIAQESAAVKTRTLEFGMSCVMESKSKDGTGLIRIIAPGQGSSGYYPEEVLKRDGPKVFKSGTQMFWDHATEQMMTDYPAQQLARQAGIITGESYYDENGPLGKGVYAPYKAFSDYKDKITERAKYGAIGISWMGYAEWKPGKVNGRETKVAQSLIAAESIDFVTLAGAGGAIARTSESAVKPNTLEEKKVAKIEIEDTELTLLRENANKATALENKLKSAREAAAKVIVNSKLSLTKLSDKAKENLSKLILRDIPITEDGMLDETKFNADVDALTSDFATESGTTNNTNNGKIELGGGGKEKATELTPTQVREARVNLYMRQGFSKEAAEKMAY